MEFKVVAQDGTTFGPANLETLNEWAREGRILPDTVLIRVSDGAMGPASKLPGMVFPESSIQAPPAPEVPSTAGRAGNVRFIEPTIPGSPPRVPTQDPSPQSPYEQPALGYTPAQESAVINRFNWGAFFLTWIWGINHRAYATFWILAPWPTLLLLLLITYWIARGTNGSFILIPDAALPFIFIIWVLFVGALHIWFGAKGNEWAWSSGRYSTPRECQRVQNSWGAIGGTIIGSLTFVMVLSLVAARWQPRNPFMSSSAPPVSSPGFGPGFGDDPSDELRRQMDETARQNQERMSQQMADARRRSQQRLESMRANSRMQMEDARRRAEQQAAEARQRMQQQMERMRNNSPSSRFPR